MPAIISSGATQTSIDGVNYLIPIKPPVNVRLHSLFPIDPHVTQVNIFGGKTAQSDCTLHNSFCILLIDPDDIHKHKLNRFFTKGVGRGGVRILFPLPRVICNSCATRDGMTEDPKVSCMSLRKRWHFEVRHVTCWSRYSSPLHLTTRAPKFARTHVRLCQSRYPPEISHSIKLAFVVKT